MSSNDNKIFEENEEKRENTSGVDWSEPQAHSIYLMWSQITVPLGLPHFHCQNFNLQK